MPIVGAGSDSNTTRSLDAHDSAVYGEWMTMIALGTATLIAAICAGSDLAYLGRDGGYFFAFVLSALAITFASLRYMVRARVPGLKMNLIRGVPIAAGIGGVEMKRYTRAASRAVKTWSAGVILLVLIAVTAAGPLRFFPGGDGSVQHGQYVETEHGAVLRIITKAEYEDLNMRTLRFGGTIASIMLVGLARLLSGVTETEKRGRPAPG